MGNRLSERLAKVEEAAIPRGKLVLAWQRPDETPEQALDRYYMERPAEQRNAATNITIVRWLPVQE